MINYYLQQYAIRRALSLAVAITIAGIVSHALHFASPGFAVLTAFAVNQTSKGASLRQASIYFFLLVLLSLFISGVYPPATHWIKDVVYGGVIGILCNQFILPVRPYAEFARGVLPLIRAITLFNAEMINLLSGSGQSSLLKMTVHELEKTLQTRYSAYPEWVYEVGFNRGLRKGYRFFLVHIERITEIIFSLHYRMTLLLDNDHWQDLSSALIEVVSHNNQLLNELHHCLLNNAPQMSEANFTDDMQALEAKARQVVPAKLELLDIYPDNITLVMVVRDLKDMRRILLQLLLAVSNQQ